MTRPLDHSKQETPDADDKNSPGFERRRQNDRRKDSRDGKRDRRQNRCGACNFYSEQRKPKENPTKESPNEGLCQKHQKMVAFDEFACVLFAPIS